MSILKIIRKNNIFDFLRKDYKIILDDVDIGVIKSNEIIELDIEDGKHAIYIQLNSIRSRVIDFQIDEKETKEFLCGSYLGFDDAINFIFTFGLIASLYKSFLIDLNLYIIPVVVNGNEKLPCTPLLKKKRAVVVTISAFITLIVLGTVELLYARYYIFIIVLIGGILNALNLCGLVKSIKKEEMKNAQN